MGKKLIATAIAAAVVSVTACETTGTGIGAGLAPSGNGGQATTNMDVYRCDKPLGNIAIRDKSAQQYRSRYQDALNGDSVGAVLRDAVLASNCFKVIAVANDSMNSDLDTIAGHQRTSDDVRPGSEFQGGQAEAADYALYPQVIFKEQDSGGNAFGGVGGLLGAKIPIIAGGAAKTNIKSSTMALELWDIRSRALLATGRGDAKVQDFSFAVAGIPGIPAGGAFTQASKSPEGKATLVAMLEAYKQMVIGLQNYQEQQVENGGTGGALVTR